MYTCNGQGWMCVDNSSSVFHASTHPSCGGGGFISGTLQWATHGCLSNCCQTGSLSILRKSLMCTETFLWNYGLKTLCETCGGVNLVEHCLFKATVTETVTPKVKDPTRYVMWKNSSNFIWKRNASKKCSSAFIKCYWELDFFSHLEKLIWCLCVWHIGVCIQAEHALCVVRPMSENCALDSVASLENVLSEPSGDLV